MAVDKAGGMRARFSGSVLGAGLMLALAGCVQGPVRTAPILDGAVHLALPQGYCIDQASSRQGKDQAVVLMGRCSSASAPDAALITVAVGMAGSASVLRGGGEGLAELFKSDRGRALLARSGRARDVQILSASQQGDLFLLRLKDRRLGDYWRAVTGVRGRLVTVSATGAPGEALPPEAGRALVVSLAEKIRRINAPRSGAGTGSGTTAVASARR